MPHSSNPARRICQPSGQREDEVLPAATQHQDLVQIDPIHERDTVMTRGFDPSFGAAAVLYGRAATSTKIRRPPQGRRQRPSFGRGRMAGTANPEPS